MCHWFSLIENFFQEKEVRLAQKTLPKSYFRIHDDLAYS